MRSTIHQCFGLLSRTEKQLSNFKTGSHWGVSRLCSSSAAETNNDNTGKNTTFDKFNDEDFFGKFVNEGLDAEEEAMLEGKDYEKEFKRSGKPEFVPDEFEKLSQ